MPERLIFHVDVNSAFLSWEAVWRLRQGETTDLRTIPSIVGGDREKRRGVVLAKSIPAKAFGVATGEPIVDALRKCPGLLCVPARHDLYSRCSRAFIEVLARFAPVIEQVSVDEAFADMSGTGLLYGPPLEAAALIKNTIRGELGFTVNVGVSSNKLLAKMASDFQKPDRIHTLFPDEIAQKMWPLPVGKLFSVGQATKRCLADLGIHTIGDLAHSDLSLVRSHLKKQGEVIWHYANGLDERPVEAAPAEPKSYGNETTLSKDITHLEEARPVLLSLCESVAARLRADQVQAACITVKYTDYQFGGQTHQRMLASPTDVTEELYQTSVSLLAQMWKSRIPLRLLGVSASRLSGGGFYQYNLFDGQKHERLGRLDAAIDAIRSRYGSDAVRRGRFLPPPDRTVH
ncbi:MAG: DNA polymerase IV [Lachnospiraceae bacterium]|nr:DNA polymerase IV [Lachnospiraceae bacterium]